MVAKGTVESRVAKVVAWLWPTSSRVTPGLLPARIPCSLAEVRPWRTKTMVGTTSAYEAFTCSARTHPVAHVTPRSR